MKVKIFDEEQVVNEFILDKEIIDIKFQVAVSVFAEEQIFCFSAMILYR